MAKKLKTKRPAARLPKGFIDVEAADIRSMRTLISRIEAVYQLYGFEPLETPAFEYTDALGKFLPDADRPNAGVFSLQDDDEQWMSLRYDLTAPLARYVAQHFDALPKPFRRYAVGPVWRNEKPGPGRFRQFMQFDADTVGTDSLAADAEICMLAADTLAALGFEVGEYKIRLNSREVLDGLLESIGLDLADEALRLTVLRSLDKLDKFTRADVALLLGPGRKDDSGDFTKGAGLGEAQINALLDATVSPDATSADDTSATHQTAEDALQAAGFTASPLLQKGLSSLDEIEALVRASGYGADRITRDPSVVRGLDYYTGPVFEAELTFQITGDDGQPVRFGSVGGGGRYDGLVARFTGRPAPATGFSIGVSRLQAALTALDRSQQNSVARPVVVLVMDYAELPRHQELVSTLRAAGIRAEMYLGTSGVKAQMKYADKRGAPCVIIEGPDEKTAGIIQIKDLIEGAKASLAIKDNKEWKETRPAQFSVPVDRLVDAVKEVLARHYDVDADLA